ncbi:MBL fold metallo-hydrolase [bacterium]|jgi:metallo-beta-lactamase family protein|nr:MBL fold metallo-hydrolase [bacterium]MBT4649269.1 MBL fold metallo-hydrolase [bacterium]
MAKIKLTSFGAHEEVTGSCHLLEIDNFRLLIDCGLFQGDWNNYLKNWEPLGFNPKTIDAVILTHAHLDHCGRLPLLVQKGFKGKVYTTNATMQIVQIILADNQRILAHKAKKNNLPTIYSDDDVVKLNKRWETVSYYQKIKLADDISFTLHNAGHILGSGIIEIKVADSPRSSGAGKTIVFSGDLGACDMPLVKNVDYLNQADFVIMEGTYGDREHEMTADREKKLLEAVQKVTLNNSVLLISIFAIERTQNILKVLNDYYENHLDFRTPVFLDSPMAARATKVYKQHLSLLNQDAQDDLKRDRDIFDFPHLKVTTDIRDSKSINHLRPPKIIMAGSGMAEGGRLIHHLARYISDERNQVLFMGYQVPGTLGHKLTHGAFDFDYYDKHIKIKAAVDKIDGFSAHADKSDLLKWANSFTPKAKIFLVHGNKESLEALETTLKTEFDKNVEIIKNEPIVLCK